ncbi:caspase Dronc [Drosophila innubila]|uniref:caspase Dronc n=1 Tax=Drosophila innubila TaxID=198719 RepID=UPI00148CD752|nr:caspase Dronc [Drosophila innubila]
MEGEQERELGMQQNHRNHILENIEDLIKLTSYFDLMTETVRRGILSQRMREIIENRCNMSDSDALHEQHRRYFEKITKRGPKAYDNLKRIFGDLRFVQALRILEAVEDPNSGQPYVSIRTSRNQANQIHNNNNSNNNSINNNNNHNNSGNSNSNSNKSTDIVDNRIKSHFDPNGPLIPYTEPVVGETRVVQKSDRIHRDEFVGTYTMQSEHDRGVLLIVNIIDFPNPDRKRTGAELDEKSLIHIFSEFGFTIFNYVNLNHDEFFTILRTLTSSECVRRTECFVMALMTHGERSDEKDRVLFTDGSVSDVRTIIDHFQVDTCRFLLNKPKVLIFPFCRGDRPDPGQTVIPRHIQPLQRMPTQTDGMGTPLQCNNVPTLSDLLVCYASVPGWETHREPNEGSWYIQKLCDFLAEHAHDKSLEDILKKTQLMVGNMRTQKYTLQTGANENLGFNKKLFFNPGFYNDPNTAT